MIAVENVIRKLVTEYEFVIIPGFGALLSHQVPASYDSNSMLFTPPVKRLAFNEFLKLDDGLLANYISRHERIAHPEAVQYVKAYTEKLRFALESAGKTQIQGIGAFTKNIEGKLIFEPNTGKYFKDEWFGFYPIKVKELDRSSITFPEVKVYEHTSEDNTVIFEKRKTRPLKWGSWAAAASVAGLLCCLSLFFVTSSNFENKSTLNPFTELFTREPVTVSLGSDKEIIADQVREEEVEVGESPEVKTIEVEADSEKVITKTPVLTPASETNAVSPVQPVNEGSFFVIAGAFKGMRQANVLLSELKAKGFKDAFLIPADVYSKKVKVAVSSYSKESDAYRASVKLKAVIGEAGWVYSKK